MIKYSSPVLICSFFLSIMVLFDVYALNLEKRIDTLIFQMSKQEKIDQLINDDFMTTPANSRLKIPGFVMNDGPHGVRQPDRGTAFPTGIAMAATWDKKIAFKTGKAMGEEFWAYGRHQQLGPCIDLTQDPRAGRNAESGGEDPYLCGQIGAYVTRGIQCTPVIATVKHFMIEGKQSNRNERNEIFTDRWACEHYGYNFRTVVQEGSAMSVMVSYNLINGIQASESNYLLDTLLRQRWGFPFYVVSDWAAIHENRALQAINAGTDLCMGNDVYKWELPDISSDSAITKAVRNVLRTKILSGMLDYYPPGNMNTVNSQEHRQISLEAARKSIILLKNSDNILPASKQIKIALIGPNADEANLNCFGSSETDPIDPVSLKSALVTRLGSDNVLYTQGCDINSDSKDNFQKAIDLAKQADLVIFAGGLDQTQEGEGYGKGNDRTNNSTELPGTQQDLIIALAAENPNIIAVIQSGGVCSMKKSIASLKGLIYSFYAGHDAGTAISDVIFGDYNPAGRLPVTMTVDDSQLPEWNDDFTDDFGCGYRWFDENKLKPQFPFGFGLSYTTFTYNNLCLLSDNAPAGSPIKISVDVKNTGTIDGEEVVELYLSNLSSSLWMPQKELKGFERIKLDSGEKKTVTFSLTAEDFYYWDETEKSYKVNSGDYIIRIGGSSDNLPLKDTLTLTPATAKPDLKITEVFTMPRYPKKGDQVYFYALVKNQGTAPLTGSDLFNISYSVNESIVAQTENISITLNPGQAQLISSSESFKATAESFPLTSSIDTYKKITEWIEDNNSYTKQIGIPGPKIDLSKINIALNQPVSASSNKDESKPLYVVDSNNNSRWESDWNDSQWICIDLGLVNSLNKIVIHWEAAFASDYSVLLSIDSSSWFEAFSTSSGDGQTDTINFPSKDSRYVKINCIKRSTQWGFSIYEIEVYPTPVKTEKNTSKISPKASIVHTPQGYLLINDASRNLQNIKICNLQGRMVYTAKLSAHGISSININALRNGIYIINCTGPLFSVKRKILIRN